MSLNHSYPFLNFFEFSNSIQGRTKLNSIEVLSKRKRNRDKIYNEDKENREEKKLVNNNANTKKMGRRLKGEKYENEASHNKYSDDNIITKLKTAIFKYILNLLNQSLEFTKYKFYPLNVKLNTCLKKEFNIKLLERTIYDIYNTEDLKKEFNIKLLERTIYDIYNTEDLNKTYINGNDSNKKLIKIESKNEGKYNDLVKHLLLTYEDWFKIKNGRNNKKIKSMK